MTGRLETRIEKLEARQPAGTGALYALARYQPPAGGSDWLGDMLSRLKWPSSTFALVMIDANDPATAEPEEVIAPTQYERMSQADRTRFLLAGEHPGRWYLIVTGRGHATPIPMFNGRAALMTEIRASAQQQGGYFGGAF
ncbi:hypothetical protein KZ813_17910 [Sphingomonas sp. RHCKR7]|uniref:hypothetical protein n=1 Tax=Sphingomonas folli TaxID=2862497 RepID=UPI001CA5D2F7|nr:hypothetical protein [Sphingomonas folli]MBW6528721.1 hypothetical protein [Sphingomonas folli]